MIFIKTPSCRGFCYVVLHMETGTRTLSAQESKVVLALTEGRRREATRAEIVELLGGSAKAADHVIESLRRKGWLERATWGEYLLVPPEQGPDVLGDSNLLARASRIADPYYLGFATAAAQYGLTTQHRNVIFVVTPVRLRARAIGESRVQIVNLASKKFFGFEPVDVLGYKVMMSDREKTALDCVERPDLAGGVGEAAVILANASRRLDWNKALGYMERLGSGALARRTGWLLEYVNANVPPAARDALVAQAARSRNTWFGPDPVRARAVEGAMGYDEKWKVFVNVRKDELRDSVGLAHRQILKRDA
jgi:predicted transcriptional regulator of viral defense system